MPAVTPAMLQPSLFADEPMDLPDGLRYQADFLSREEEAGLLRIVASLPLAPMQYKGFSARREVLSFGGSYDFSAGRLDDAPGIPVELEPLRLRVAQWAGLAQQALAHALVARYTQGTPLGWHRDVPEFEDILGVSLAGDAVMRLRPWPPREPRRAAVRKLVVAPRSIYLMRGPARWAWQHSVAPVGGLRYSITFRTRRGRLPVPAATVSPPAREP